jgi:hypothetical protein
MKLAKNFVAAMLLVLAISLTSFAGDQQTPGAPTPQPPPPNMMAAPAKTETSDVINVSGTPEEVGQTADTFWYEVLLGLLSIY